ncbi:hypothetical protein [Halpernia sp. GG3]
MKRILAVGLVLQLLLISCSIEKINLSPISDEITKDLYSPDDVGIKTEIIAYQSELSNLISSFPKFNNRAVDKEVSNLKISLTSYIEAISKKDNKTRQNSYNNYVVAYKKIQILRSYLNKDMGEILNRYMVRIKTNVNLLESIS